MPGSYIEPNPIPMKGFQSHTLNDNWFEERAPKLRGVLADYGERSFQTTSKEHYKTAETRARADARMQKSNTKMICLGSYNSALKRDTTLSPDLPTMNTNLLRTQPRSPEAAPTPDPWVRGRCGERVEMGMRTSGLSGEAFKQDADPQNDTASQRSWVYAKDPALTTKPRSAESVEPYPSCIPGPNTAVFDPDVTHFRTRVLTKPSNGRFMDHDE